MKIAVIGAGWYGCHIAIVLKGLGYDVTVFEENEQIFQGASGYNQNRLHLGFHYPRSWWTRKQSRSGFAKFNTSYGSLTRSVADNLYAIDNCESFVDWMTYRSIMSTGGLLYDEVETKEHGLNRIEGCLRCNERVVDVKAAREYFKKVLGSDLHLSTKYTGDSTFDIEVNCTYQGWQPVAERRYEPCIVLVYETSEDRAITIMDGPFWSIYPIKEGLSSLYSVRSSRLGWCYHHQDAKDVINGLTQTGVDDIRSQMEQQTQIHFPDFCDRYNYSHHYTSIRAISNARCDNRACEVIRIGKMIHVAPGKIDGIFYAAEVVVACLGC